MVLKGPESPKEAIPEVSWPHFLRGLHSGWEQGHHISALGRTRGGKTTALVQVLEDRKYVIALLTKRHDDLFPLLKKRGFKMIDDLGKRPGIESAPRVAIHLAPDGLTKSDGVQQADRISRLLHQVWLEKGWTLYLDEIAALADTLGMGAELRSLWKEAASSKVTLVAGTQRPARVPLEMYSQPRFLMLWATQDREELRRLAGMNGANAELVRDVVQQLDRFEVLVADLWTGEMVRTRPPKLPGG